MRWASLTRLGARTYSVGAKNASFKYDNIEFDIDVNRHQENGSKVSRIDMFQSDFRNKDGSFVKGQTSSEARLHDWTLKGRQDRSITKLPKEIAKVINQVILPKYSPDRLRARVATMFQSLKKDQIQKAPEDGFDCDAYIAALFLQDYTNVRQVLLELKGRIGADKFNPQRVLDIGYGPSTGIVALNEIMGDQWIPEEKESYIIGRSNEMKQRSKIILSRQLNENVEEIEVEVEEEEEEELAGEAVATAETTKETEATSLDDQQESIEEINQEKPQLVGNVDVSKIKTYTKFRDSLPLNKQYDLIIVNQCLLKRSYNFPKDVDSNVHNILRLLSPGGRIVFVERGNALGFETIARARQLMIRPENFERERGKIARPYVKGSSVKPRKLKSLDSIITEEDIEFEKQLLAKYGEVDEKDLKFEFEDSDEFELIEVNPPPKEEINPETESSESDYHLTILAPCPHHSKCPLQLGDPSYYKIPKYKNRLNFCSFHKTVERPKYTMELKKGKRLATKWDTSYVDGFGLENLPKSKLQQLEGSGRPGGNDFETGSYSYMIAERSLNDEVTHEKIKEQRKYQSEQLDASDINNWPRILKQPAKQKQNVKFEVCAPSGKLELWDVPKSVGKQEYHDARKAIRGDLWALGKKTVHVRHGMSESKAEFLKKEAKKTKKRAIKEERKRKLKQLAIINPEDVDENESNYLMVAEEAASNLENSSKYKQAGKKAGFAVDPRDFDGL